jgi:hypothetical protein
MFKKSLLAALCLISALTAQAAPTPNIPITQSQLPFTISTPGTYVLTGNLSYTSGSEFGAININGAIGGAVVIDLKGFTLTSASGASKAGVSISENTFPTTIRNGTITSFANGISVFVSGNPPILSNITIKNIVFNQESNAGVNLDQLIDGATVNGCTFDNCGISDSLSTGGNSYNNNTFGSGVALDVQSYCCGTPLVLNRCQFASPPATGLIMNAIPVKAAPSPSFAVSNQKGESERFFALNTRHLRREKFG